MSISIDCHSKTTREINRQIREAVAAGEREIHVLLPEARHNLGVALLQPVRIIFEGSVGYYCAGMNKRASITIDGNAGTGVAENMMSGRVHVKGDVSQSAGATGCGGLLIVDGNASSRCGISLRGLDIVVKGSVGHMSAFMAQAGTLVVLGDAGDALGDSIYEARLYVRGQAGSLGADCVVKDMRDAHKAALRRLLDAAGVGGGLDVSDFRRYGSARALYNFHIDNLGSY